MAAKNRANGPDPLALNGTEQQQMDLFQNLEKLIASAVSICRLDGSVQCQIGGLITVIEELQRLLRHSFAEIKRLERNLDDQKHTFTNNITNLHYQVKEVQSSVENLKCESEEAQKTKETSSNQEESVNKTVDNDLAPQVSLVDESYGYEEESDGSIGLSQFNEEPSRPDLGKEDVTDVVGESDAANDQVPSPRLETTSKNASTCLLETATSTSEEQESALRILRSALSKSGASDKEQTKKNHRLKGLTKSVRIEAKSNRSRILASKKSRTSKSPLVITNQHASPKTPPQNTKIHRKGTPPTKQFLNRAKRSSRPLGKQTDNMQRSPQKKITQKLSKMSKVRSIRSPVKASVSASKRKRVVLTKLQRKVNLSKKSTKIIAQSSKRGRPLKLKSNANHSASPKANTSNTKLNNAKASQSFSRENKEPNTMSKNASTVPEVENPMDKYINLDFLLNANQLMSELVTDPGSEEGTLDTASDIERRNIVDLAKLYRLRVRMAGGKYEGELPVALIKGRESSLPKPGQVDQLLYKMKHAMAIKQQIMKTKAATKKRKLADSGSRRNMASSAKKRRF